MIEEEIVRVRELQHIGLALVEFARSLRPGTAFVLEGQRWVAQPDNFVTFEVHSQRAHNNTLSLRGNPDEFLFFEELPLKQGMNGYSNCSVTSARHLSAASSYIARASELFTAGRTRVKAKPVLRFLNP